MEYFASSIFLKYFKKYYLAIEEKIRCIYLNSSTHRSMKKSLTAIKTGFSFSALGRLTRIDECVSRNFLETSKAKKIVLNALKNPGDRLTRYSAASQLVISSKNLRYGFFSRPLKVGGMITVTAITVNTYLALILHKEMNLTGIIYRLILFFLGILGIFSEADWEGLISNSVILRRIRKKG